LDLNNGLIPCNKIMIFESIWVKNSQRFCFKQKPLNSFVYTRISIAELPCLLSFLGFDSCPIVIFRERGYAPIENQIIFLSRLAKVQHKFLHFAIQQNTAAIIPSFYATIQKDEKKPRRVTNTQ